MAAILEWADIKFETQVPIGKYCVDFYLPESGGVVEVDGEYWHKNGSEKRDAFLLSHGVSYVTHVTDRQLKEAGWL
jgi:very-short-patch-repair endonuclease